MSLRVIVLKPLMPSMVGARLRVRLVVALVYKAPFFVNEVNPRGLMSGVTRPWRLSVLVFHGVLFFLPLNLSQKACVCMSLLLGGVYFHALLKEGDIGPKVINTLDH